MPSLSNSEFVNGGPVWRFDGSPRMNPSADSDMRELFGTVALENGRQKSGAATTAKPKRPTLKKWTQSSDFVKVRPMLGEGKPIEEFAALAIPAPKRGIESESFQDWFRGGNVMRADGGPLPIDASLATVALKPKYTAALESARRVPVQTLIDYLEGGDTIDNFLEGFPTVRREQVIAFSEEARDHVVAAAS